MSSGSDVGSGPCGACKFLRRKCLRGCIFAPYFDSDQGTAYFAAVHKVFGASNASKLLLSIPAHKRLDAVVTLCYEALARVRDPVYGCVAHIFTLQQQVVNLQAELAFIQARLSTVQRLPVPPPQLPQTASLTNIASPSSQILMHFDDHLPLQTSTQMSTLCHPIIDQEEEIEALAREFVSRYLPGVRFKPSTSH